MEQWTLGGIEYEMEQANKLSREANEITRDSQRERLIQELREKGMILPEYDWKDKEFNDTLEAITADWFVRHPETKRSGGEFDKKYPEKAAALDLMERMSAMGRITPEEYIIIYREIFNF